MRSAFVVSVVVSLAACGPSNTGGTGGGGATGGTGGTNVGGGGVAGATGGVGGEGGTTGTGGSTSVSQVIGTSGGTLTAPDGAALVIPAGALSADTTITLTRVENFMGVYSARYDLQPDGLTFAVPASLTLPIDPALSAGVPSSDMAIAAEDDQGLPNGAGWTLVDRATQEASALITHFSKWAVWPSPGGSCTVSYSCLVQCSGTNVPLLCCDGTKGSCKSVLNGSFFGYVDCYTKCQGTPKVANFGSSACMSDCCTSKGWFVASQGGCYSNSGSAGEALSILACASNCALAPNDTNSICAKPGPFQACQWSENQTGTLGDDCTGQPGSGVSGQFLFTDLFTVPAQTWGANPAVINVLGGTFDGSTMTLNLACANGAPFTGTMTLTWTGQFFTGPWTFGTQSGNATVSPGWL